MNRRRLASHLTLRNAGLTLLATALVAAMTAMGIWQLDAYNDRQALDAAQTAQAEPAPLDRLLRPDQAFTAEAHARPVVVEGEYGEQQLLVDRGSQRPWVVAPLRTDTGSAILVVRGLAEAQPATGDAEPAGAAGAAGAARQPDPPAPPQGSVRVVGSLQPSQARGVDTDRGDLVVPTLSTAQLIDEFGADLYSGYVVLTDQTPPSELPEATPPLPDASLTAGLRNLMYAVQWWVFAGFVAFMWWRMVREEPQVA